MNSGSGYRSLSAAALFAPELIEGVGTAAAVLD